MLRSAIRKVCFGTVLAATLSVLTGLPMAGAGLPAAPNVLYKAYGTFSEPPISGQDLFRLQGEPFNISVTASAASTPIHSGHGYAVYSPLPMTGTVKSGLLSSPTNINSHSASIELQSGPAGETFTLGSPIKVVGLQMTINAVIKLPPGTLTNLYIHPFTAPVSLGQANATLTYSAGTDSTKLSITGMLTATIAGNTIHSASMDAAPMVGSQETGDGSQGRTALVRRRRSV